MVSSGLSAPTDSLGGILAASASPVAAHEIGQFFKEQAAQNDDGKLTTGQEAAHIAAHAILGAAVAAAGGNDAVTSALAAGGAELATPIVSQWLYGTSDPKELTAEQKETLSSIGGLIGASAGAVSGDVSSIVAGSQVAQNAVDNNYLSQAQQVQRDKEIAACQTLSCRAGVRAKWTAVDMGQDGSFAAGMIAGVPAELYGTVNGIVEIASSPIETYQALKTLFSSGDVLSNVSDAVKQSYIDRINEMEVEYQKAGTSGSFNAGVEGGKLITDIAGLIAGGGGVVKGGTVLTEKVVAKVAGKAESAVVGATKGTASIISREATSSLQGSKLNDYYRQLEKYGQAGVKELENGSFRFYSEIKPASTKGEMAGARLVREWNPSSGKTRTWYETVDHAGNVRSVAPKPVVEDKNHRIFDADGNYQGRR